MSKPFARALLLAVTICSAALAQSPPPAEQPLNLQIMKGSTSTVYLDGTRPIAKMTSKGLTSYAYKDGRPVIAMRSDGRYAQFKYENGKLDRIEYSDGTVRRAGERLNPSTGASIAARGGVTPMNWDSDWGGWDDKYYFQNDDFGGRFGGEGDDGDGGGGGGAIEDDLPEHARPNTPLGRLQCLYAAARTLEISLLQVCPMMRDRSVCIDRVVTFNNRTIAWCMGG